MMAPSIIHKHRGAAAVFVALGLSVLLTAPVQAIDQGGLGGRPAHPKPGNARSQSIFVHTLQPGKEASDAVQVINNTGETKHILVYAVDSQTSSGGAFACAQAADKPLSVGSWVTLEQTEVTLASGAKQTIDFTVRVPKDAAPGEHNGCIVIQDTKQQAAPDSNGIVLSLRSAIRLAVTVPGDIQKGLVLTGLGFERKGDEKVLLGTSLKNNGNVSLDTQVEIKLQYPLGLSAATVGGTFPVLSGSEGRFNFEAQRPFWGGWYRLSAAARYNDNPAAALGEGQATARLNKSSWVYVAPDPLAVIIEVVLLGAIIAGAVLLVRRKRAHSQALRRATKHTVKPHENLHTIAQMHHMPWKQLARLNKLKPPYQLKPGQTLLVTPSRHKPHSKN